MSWGTQHLWLSPSLTATLQHTCDNDFDVVKGGRRRCPLQRQRRAAQLAFEARDVGEAGEHNALQRAAAAARRVRHLLAHDAAAARPVAGKGDGARLRHQRRRHIAQQDELEPQDADAADARVGVVGADDGQRGEAAADDTRQRAAAEHVGRRRRRRRHVEVRRAHGEDEEVLELEALKRVGRLQLGAACVVEPE